MNPMDSMDSMDSMESMECMESMEFMDSMDSLESMDFMDSIDSIQLSMGSYLSEDPGPHAVFFPGWEGLEGGWAIQGVTVVVVGSQKYWKNKKILVFDGVGHGF